MSILLGGSRRILDGDGIESCFRFSLRLLSSLY